MAQIKSGSRWRSSVCATEVMVIQAPGDDVALSCGGAAMVPVSEKPAGGSPAPEAAKGTQLGKRYVDADAKIELLCTKPGEGSLGIGDTLLTLKEAKALPSSD